tara:strand:- start:706 stop:1584 length:879 start_codon:yes stop_codon:yes gene_type:complete
MADKKHISNKRSQQLEREIDNFKEPQVGLYDVDEAIHYYFENVIQPRVKEGENEIRVPIVYGSPERWSSVQKSGVFRDETGKVQLPLIMYRRTSVEKNRNISKNLDANNPNLFMTFEKEYNPRNRYDNFSILVGRQPSRKFHNVVIPDYVTLTYECIIWTDFIAHQNKIVEDINYASDSYWGKPEFFKFLASLDSFEISNELDQGTDRMSKAAFTLTLSGYIITDNLQKDMTQFNKKAYGVAEVNLFTTDVAVVNDINEVYDTEGNPIMDTGPESNLSEGNPDGTGWTNIND